MQSFCIFKARTIKVFMKDILLKAKNGKAAEWIKRLLLSYKFPFITAAVELICYYLGLDVVTFLYIGVTAVAALLLLEDLTPIIGIALFSGCMISVKNSPSPLGTGTNYYSHPAVLTVIGIIATVIAAALIYRVVLNVKNKQVKFTPMFWGYVALSLAFMCSGFFDDDYSAKHLLYGLLMTVFHFGFFVLISSNVKITEENYKRIAFSFLALSFMLLIELAVVYLTTPNIINDFNIHKESLFFGWGQWNTIGMFFVSRVPFILYLAGKYKWGWVLTLYSIVIVLATVLTASRQSMLAIAVIYVISYAVLIFKGKNRWINLSIAVVTIISALIVITIFSEEIVKFLNNMIESLVNTEGEFTGNGRTGLIDMAIQAFKANPVFGGGWYVQLAEDPGFVGIALIPEMYHNSVFQMLGACGILGLLTYGIHRIQTVIVFFRRPTTERTTLALVILGLIIMGFFDNHIFYIFPTMFYTSIIAILHNSEKPPRKLKTLTSGKK